MGNSTVTDVTFRRAFSICNLANTFSCTPRNLTPCVVLAYVCGCLGENKRQSLGPVSLTLTENMNVTDVTRKRLGKCLTKFI